MVKKLLVLLILNLILTSVIFGGDDKDILPANLTEDEMKRLDEIGLRKTVTPPPEGEFFMPAEYDQCDGVIFSWDSGFSTLITNLIEAVTQYDTAFVVVSGSSEQNSVENYLDNTGTDLTKVVFIYDYLNSVWMRDYGPWWGLDEEGDRFIIDFIYNRPRPDDDEFPEWLSNDWDIQYYSPDLVHSGGNFMVDGNNMGFMTSLVTEENSQYSEQEIRQIFREYCSLDSVVILTPMQYDGTGHIDMFCKLLNDSTIIIGEYENPSDGAGQNYNILNQNAETLADLTNPEGKPYNVERIIMPPYSGGTSYTYTNSLIVNDLVLVPVYGFTTDSEALALYQELMPGHEIIGFDCNNIIPYNGAIHCITKLAMSKQEIENEPVMGDVTGDEELNVLDVVMMVNIILQQTDATDEQMIVGDLSADGEISVADIIMLVSLIMA